VSRKRNEFADSPPEIGNEFLSVTTNEGH